MELADQWLHFVQLNASLSHDGYGTGIVIVIFF